MFEISTVSKDHLLDFSPRFSLVLSENEPFGSSVASGLWHDIQIFGFDENNGSCPYIHVGMNSLTARVFGSGAHCRGDSGNKEYERYFDEEFRRIARTQETACQHVTATMLNGEISNVVSYKRVAWPVTIGLAGTVVCVLSIEADKCQNLQNAIYGI